MNDNFMRLIAPILFMIFIYTLYHLFGLKVAQLTTAGFFIHLLHTISENLYEIGNKIISLLNDNNHKLNSMTKKIHQINDSL